MSRNSSGTYSLPAGNPVVTGTTITSAWANGTMNDIAAALTDSLSRSGQGSMTAGLKLFDGTSALPGLAFGSETTSGLYRNAAGDLRWVVATAEILQFRAARIDTTVMQVFNNPHDATGEWSALFSNAIPQIAFNETDAAADNRLWLLGPSGEQFTMSVLDDAESVTVPFMAVNRTGTTVDSVNFNPVSFQYGGLEIGYRGLPSRTISASDNTAASDNGRLIGYVGTGGHTLTIDTDLSAVSDATTIILNVGTGSLTIAESLSGSLQWLNGSGSLATGSRTLTVGGIATIYRPAFDANNAYIWGTGLS